jgi:hypothetical protein
MTDKQKEEKQAQSLGFMYAPPPGFIQQKEGNILHLLDSITHTLPATDVHPNPEDPQRPLKLEEKFEFLKNAPRVGTYTQDLPVHHRPLGIEVR